MANHLAKKRVNKIISLNEKVLERLPEGALSELIAAMNAQIGDAELDKESRRELKEKLGVDDKSADGWNNVGDVLKMVDVAEMLKNNPDLAKKAVDAIVGVISFKFPAAQVGKTLLAEVPEEVFEKLIGVVAIADPVHLAHVAADNVGKKVFQKAVDAVQDANDILAKPEEYDSTLVIVAKDEFLAQGMAELVERQDDTEEGIVGTKDGSVYVISADEKFYLDYLADRITDQRILFIGDLKSSKELRKTAEKRFDAHGVSYGWTDRDAFICSDIKKLDKKEAYEAFLNEINEIDFDRLDKANARFKMNLVAAAKIAFATPILLKDAYDYHVRVTRQQLIYGIYKMYMQDLDEFLH